MVLSYQNGFVFLHWFHSVILKIKISSSCQMEQPEYDHSDSETEFDDDNNDDTDSIMPEFPEIEEKILACIRRFTNVFPKMNWSSCEDSRWIQATGTKCSNITDVFLLLNSSDKIVHDLTVP